MPLARARRIQFDLIWTGDYNGLVNGEFGDRAIAAVKAFQKRSKAKETGVLNPQERAALAAAAKPKQDAVGWRCRRRSGDRRAGRPAGQARAAAAARAVGGTRWASAQGEFQIETFRIAQPGTTLQAVFEQQKKGAGRPQGRIQRAARRFLRDLRAAGPEEVLRARAAARRRGARHHHPLRPGDGRHHGAGGGRDVERLCAVPERRARPRRRRAARSNTAPASWSAPAISSPTARRSRAATSSRSPASATPIASPTTRRASLRCCACTART